MTPVRSPRLTAGICRWRRAGIEPVWLSRPAAGPTMAVADIPTGAPGLTVSPEAFVGLFSGPQRHLRVGFV